MASIARKLLGATILGALIATVASCGRLESSTVTIEMRTVARINDCHVSLDLIRYYKDGSPMGDFRFVCGAAESALKEKNWWGDQPQPLMFSMLVGDCMRLRKTWYCAEEIKPGKSVTLKATFQTVDSDVTVIDRIR